MKKGNDKKPGKTLKIDKYPSEFQLRSTKLNEWDQYKFTQKKKILSKLEHEITESYMKINAAIKL